FLPAFPKTLYDLMPRFGKGGACPNFKTNECRVFSGYSFGTAGKKLSKPILSGIDAKKMKNAVYYGICQLRNN
ncbi:MAG: hypothetical protein PHV82_03955, partial [Victivallaceae bacterium]|nr:hypothetical protein [Victivallaceae bacterium]